MNSIKCFRYNDDNYILISNISKVLKFNCHYFLKIHSIKINKFNNKFEYIVKSLKLANTLSRLSLISLDNACELIKKYRRDKYLTFLLSLDCDYSEKIEIEIQREQLIKSINEQ